MASIFSYAIIRLVPETYRAEQVNIGIAIFRPGKLDVRMYGQPSLLKALGVDPSSADWIGRTLHNIDDPDMTVEARWESMKLLPGLKMSPLGWFDAEDDTEFDSRIERLKADFIDRPRLPPAKPRTSSLVRELKSEFKAYHVLGKASEDLKNHKVVPNIPVGPSGKLHVDFVVKNGRYHAVETVDFRNAQDLGVSQLKDAALASITLQYAREYLGGNGTQCYLAYAAPLLIENAIAPALEVADRHVDRLFNLESDRDRRDFLDTMLEAAGSPNLFT